jgi:uncharacterized membrane protein
MLEAMSNPVENKPTEDNSIETLTKRFIDTCKDLGDSEEHVLEHLAQRLHVSYDTNRHFEQKLTFGQRLADRIAAFGGSWTFIILFFSALAAWFILNSLILARLGQPFDPYPYILLNLILSTLASLQAPVIMMSQNRQAAKDRLEAEHDYQVNLKAELEILALHEKLDTLREKQWSELVTMQQEQIRLLTVLLEQRKERTNVPSQKG